MVKNFSNKERKVFETLVQLDQDSLLKVLPTLLKQRGYTEVYATEDYIAAKGDIPVILSAHLDTVFAYPPVHIYFDSEQGVMWSPEGLGADDRAGVFAIANIIKTGLKPYIIFLTNEETGCDGAFAFVTQRSIIPFSFDDVKYIIELDRQGENDCVFYNCENENFQKYVESFGFETDIGSFSDISVICPALGLAGVNLSVGYYNEHNYIETLNVNQLYNTIDKVKNMLKEASIENFPQFKYVTSVKNELLTYLMPRNREEGEKFNG